MPGFSEALAGRLAGREPGRLRGRLALAGALAAAPLVLGLPAATAAASPPTSSAPTSSAATSPTATSSPSASAPASSAAAAGCSAAVLDPAHVLGAATATRAAITALQRARPGAIVRVRAYRTLPGGSADAQEERLEQSCTAWRGAGGVRAAGLVSVIVDRGDRKTGLYYGSAWSDRLDPSYESVETDSMNPLFRAARFDGGVAAGLRAVADDLAAPDGDTAAPADPADAAGSHDGSGDTGADPMPGSDGLPDGVVPDGDGFPGGMVPGGMVPGSADGPGFPGGSGAGIVFGLFGLAVAGALVTGIVRRVTGRGGPGSSTRTVFGHANAASAASLAATTDPLHHHGPFSGHGPGPGSGGGFTGGGGSVGGDGGGGGGGGGGSSSW